MDTKRIVSNYKEKIGMSYLFGIILSILFFVYAITKNSVYAYIGVLFITFFSVRYTLYENMQLLLFLLPNISMLVIQPYGLSALSIVNVIMIIKYIFSREKILDIKYFLLIASYLLISLVSYLIAGTSVSIITADIRVAIDLVIVLFLIAKYKNMTTKLVHDFSYAFIGGTILSGFSAILYQYVLQLFSDVRLQAINGDPNYYAATVSLSIAILVVLRDNNKLSIRQIAIFCVMLILGLLTRSRGFFVSIIPIMFYPLVLIDRKWNLQKFKLPMILLIITAAILIEINTRFFSNMINNQMPRYIGDLERGGSGRIEIWMHFMSEFTSNVKNILIGIGKPTLVVPGWGVRVQHNIYLELITGKGVIGTVIVVLIYSRLYRRIIELNETSVSSFLSCLPLLVVGLSYMFLNGITSETAIMSIALSFIVSASYRTRVMDSSQDVQLSNEKLI